MRQGNWSPRGLANYLTILRIVITPFFAWAFFYGYRLAREAEPRAALYYLGAFVLFTVAAVTDFLDGRIARQRGVTEFGKFFDPIADKLLVLAALLSFKYNGGLIPIWMILVIAGREIGVTLLRSALLMRVGKVVSASQWGKVKTTSQLTILLLSLAFLCVNSAVGYPYQGMLTERGPIFWMMWIPVLMTVASGIEFLYNNRAHFRAAIAQGA